MKLNDSRELKDAFEGHFGKWRVMTVRHRQSLKQRVFGWMCFCVLH